MRLSSSGLRKTLRGEGGLIEALKLVKEGFDKDEEAAGRVFGNVRALSGVLDLMGANAEENIALFGRMTDTTGSADKAFEAATKTIKFKFNQALSTMKVLLTKIGADLADFVVPLFEKLTKSIQFVAKVWDEISKPVKRFIIIALAVVAAVGPLLIIFGTMLTMAAPIVTAISSVIGAIAVVGTVAAGIVTAITAMLPFVPFLLAAIPLIVSFSAGFAAVAAGFGFVIKANVDFGKAWKNSIAAIKDFAKATVGFIFNFRENMVILWKWLQANWH